MTTDEFQQLWKEADAKLDRSMELNHRLMTELGTQKVHRAFNWQIVFKIMMIGLGIGWNIVVGSLAWRFRTNPVFVFSALVVLCCTAYAVGGYIVQLLLILQIRMSESILDTQKQLAQLEAVIIQTLRVGFLQTPVYTLFYLPVRQLTTGGPGFWLIQVLITGAAVLVTIWVFRTVTPDNVSKKDWVRKMVDNEGGKTIARARQARRSGRSAQRNCVRRSNTLPEPGASTLLRSRPDSVKKLTATPCSAHKCRTPHVTCEFPKTAMPSSW